MSGKLMVVVGGQFGSEAKGHIAGYLSDTESKPLHVVRVAGPNAGHCVMDPQEEGRKWKLQHIPVAAVSRTDAKLYLAAGSEINDSILTNEILQLIAAGIDLQGRLFIDCQATRLAEEYGEQEKACGLVKGIGSTGEGVGACRAARIMREAALWGGDVSVAHMLRTALYHGDTVLIEGTQGYGLGLHAGYYPKCTSSDTRAIDFLAMAGLSPWATYVSRFEVWIVLRTYPIRVAGDSGDLFRETTWDEIGVPAEHTTVTGNVRRVGHWNSLLAREAIAANGGSGSRDNVHIAITFADYNFPRIKGWTTEKRDELHKVAGLSPWIRNMETDLGRRIELLGTGPDTLIDFRMP